MTQKNTVGHVESLRHRVHIGFINFDATKKVVSIFESFDYNNFFTFMSRAPWPVRHHQSLQKEPIFTLSWFHAWLYGSFDNASTDKLLLNNPPMASRLFWKRHAGAERSEQKRSSHWDAYETFRIRPHSEDYQAWMPVLGSLLGQYEMMISHLPSLFPRLHRLRPPFFARKRCFVVIIVLISEIQGSHGPKCIRP